MQHHTAGKPEASLAFFKTATWVYPDNVTAWYNAACAAALTGDKEAALEFLTEAAARHLDDPGLLYDDADLESLRELPAFAEIRKAVIANAVAGKKPPVYWVPLPELLEQPKPEEDDEGVTANDP
jgi:hypothetical protein